MFEVAVKGLSRAGIEILKLYFMLTRFPMPGGRDSDQSVHQDMLQAFHALFRSVYKTVMRSAKSRQREPRVILYNQVDHSSSQSHQVL